MVKLYSYVITRDYGFAPNPFYKYCTLSTCKPYIRYRAEVGDIIVGIGSGAKNSMFKNKIIYVMKVQEKITYDQYWCDKRFQCKKPNMNGSKKQMYGDNIYHTDLITAKMIQENSHHSLENGETNLLNYNRDISGEYVLISNQFWYWGGNPIDIPSYYLDITKVKRQYIVIKNEEFINEFWKWILQLKDKGYINKPHMFINSFERYDGK